jgi:2-C-methyl-D-erythritol 4-phosphate cytidylyltransferase
MNIVAILANGVGERFGSNIPKQFHKICGKMVIEYVIESILESESIDKLVISTNIEANSVYLNDICEKNNIDLIEGGSTRNRTLKNVINYIDNNYKCSKLIVCDAVRPMITGELMDYYFELLDDNDAVVTAQKITDSLGCYDLSQINRERYYLMQSPEGFRFPLLRDSFDSESPLTEVTQQLPENSRIHLYFDFNNNFKLTYPADLKYLEALIKARDNEIDFSDILSQVDRLNRFLSIYHPIEAKQWKTELEKSIPLMLKNWQITEYKLIKTSHFGIIFIAKSIQYGKCVLKIIPPFIGRYYPERTCYQRINSQIMCELYDYDDSCSSILLEKCNDADVVFNTDNSSILSFFEKVMNGYASDSESNSFNDYEKVLKAKLDETDFRYRKEEIMNYVKNAIELFDNTFSKSNRVLIHGDLHRYNIMSKNGELCAIDPIGYLAPKEFDITRYIGTELTDSNTDIKALYSDLIAYFSAICDKEKLKRAVFIDIVFRLHNSLFENDNYDLTDKWLNVLSEI